MKLIDKISKSYGMLSECGRYKIHYCEDWLLISDMEDNTKAGIGIEILYDSNFNSCMVKYGFDIKFQIKI